MFERCLVVLAGRRSAWKWDADMTPLTVPSGQHAEPVLCLAALTGWTEAALATGGRDKKVTSGACCSPLRALCPLTLEMWRTFPDIRQ